MEGSFLNVFFQNVNKLQNFIPLRLKYRKFADLAKVANSMILANKFRTDCIEVFQVLRLNNLLNNCRTPGVIDSSVP